MKITLPKLEKYQQDVLKYLIDNPKDQTIIIKSPRQVGKSILLEVLLVWSAISKGGSVSICISPISAQARKLFKDIRKFAARLIASANAQLLEIEMINGSTIQLFSAESGDNLRGATVKGNGICLVDEAAYIDEEFYYNVVVPFVNVSHRPIILASTPRTKTGLFFNMYQKGMSDDKYTQSFDWTEYDLSKFLTPDLLERYRASLPRRTFLSEYLGEFVDGSSVVFGDIKSCISKSPLSLNRDSEVYIGIDWGTGTGKDNTVITTAQLQNNILSVIEQKTFNDKGTNDTIKIILDHVKSLVSQGVKDINIVVEHNSIGQVYYSLLLENVEQYEASHNQIVSWKDEIEINIQQFTTTNSSKKKMIEELSNLFERKLILIPDDRNLISELGTYECKVQSNGTITYNAAVGFHDDRVMSLGFVSTMLYNDIINLLSN